MKILSPTLHSALDYAVVLILWSAPFVFNLNEPIAMLTYTLGTVHLLLTAFTNFAFGLIKIIPLKLHGRIELLVSVVLVTTPFYLDTLTPLDSATEERFLGGFGLFVFITWFFSDYNMPE